MNRRRKRIIIISDQNRPHYIKNEDFNLIHSGLLKKEETSSPIRINSINYEGSIEALNEKKVKTLGL